MDLWIARSVFDSCLHLSSIHTCFLGSIQRRQAIFQPLFSLQLSPAWQFGLVASWLFGLIAYRPFKSKTSCHVEMCGNHRLAEKSSDLQMGSGEQNCSFLCCKIQLRSAGRFNIGPSYSGGGRSVATDSARTDHPIDQPMLLHFATCSYGGVVLLFVGLKLEFHFKLYSSWYLAQHAHFTGDLAPGITKAEFGTW